MFNLFLKNTFVLELRGRIVYFLMEFWVFLRILLGIFVFWWFFVLIFLRVGFSFLYLDNRSC